MKRTGYYIIFITSIILFLIGCTGDRKPQLPPLTETYRKTDKQPFGSFVAYDFIKKAFDNRYIQSVTDPFDEFWSDTKTYSQSDEPSLYLLITKNLVLSYTEVQSLMDYVQAGNDLFISADYIDNRLLENIECNTNRHDEIANEVLGNMRKTSVSMYYGQNIPLNSFGYYYFPFLNALSDFDTSFARVLGVNDKQQPNYILLFSGKGRIYLHAAPRAFGNYFLLNDDNYQYIANVISYLRTDPKYIYWDEYYKNIRSTRRNSSGRSRDNDFSSLSVLWRQPALRWAFLLVIAGLLMYILFGFKRKQRLIPVLQPMSNSTLDFTRTVGRLYLQKKNNQNIAEKIITYFYEYLRSRYYINTNLPEDELLNTLSRRSGMEREATAKMLSLIREIQNQDKVSDEQLLELNAAVENFKNIRTHGRTTV